MKNENHKCVIAVISNSDENRNMYESLVKAQGVEVKTFLSLQDFEATCGETGYSGFVIDLKTILGSARNEKRLLMDIEDSFPVLRVINNAATHRISGITDDRNLEGNDMFEIFIRERCIDLKPRSVRALQRQSVHLNVRLFHEKSGGKSVHTNTIDVSREGMFILSSEEIEVGTRVSFTVVEFEDQSPIQAVVRWVLPWAVTSKHLPGFGVQFIALSDSQAKEIEILTRPLVLGDET